MVRRALIAGALAAAAGAGCGAHAATRVPSGAHVAARGTLGYAAAFGDGALYTIELDERFGLFVRDPDTGALRARFDLGPAERDLPALAVAGGVAWVGGADQLVRGLAVADGAELVRWPIGAAVTGLAALPGGWLAIADADGALCLRRLADGALVQCVLAGDGPITALAAVGPALVATVGGARRGFAIPALTAADPAPAPAAIVDGNDVIRAGRALVHFAGPARAAALGPAGQLAAVGWIRGLDDPSVVVIPADRVQSQR